MYNQGGFNMCQGMDLMCADSVYLFLFVQTCVTAMYMVAWVFSLLNMVVGMCMVGGYGGPLTDDRILYFLVGWAHILLYQKVAGLALLVLHIITGYMTQWFKYYLKLCDPENGSEEDYD